jgi:hypothetical protein
MTIDQAKAAIGQPNTIVGDPAVKVIYLYNGAKLTFLNGKLAEVL